MFRLSKTQVAKHPEEAWFAALGHLEFNLMEILWDVGESSVRDVRQRLNRPLAYTTVMTTLERLHKKSLLARRRVGRAFLYSPQLSRRQWEQGRAGDLVMAFMDGSGSSRELLFSTLVDALGHHDEALLDVLENKIQVRRQELSRRGRQ
ncbi:MAG TPA: BlaI/MecI/CopY family transcriptional regulator [Candidatus Acidoferrum sp.]|jgi:predicted transcriptional regulator|nr:BlaI/MecI/CopY family transcriptional regulator [Candidatus Acidoferrum sp.]